MGTLIHPRNGSPEGLTSIHPRIHCAATHETTEDEYSETDLIIVRNFLNTLAEVALAVAIRSAKSQNEQA